MITLLKGLTMMELYLIQAECHSFEKTSDISAAGQCRPLSYVTITDQCREAVRGAKSP